MTRMLYLHGFAGCVDHVGGSKDVVAAMNLADEMIAFNAPFPVDGGGYKWFSLPGDNISGADINAEMKESAEFIASRIGPEPIDIIFGTSQGGFMALYLTLKNIIRAQRTIAAVPFYIPGLIGADMNKDTPILWMAAGTDEVIPPDVAGVWQWISDIANHQQQQIAQSKGGNHYGSLSRRL